MSITKLVSLSFIIVFLSTTVATAEPDLYKFWIPDNNWAFGIDITNYQIDLQQIRDDLKGRFCSAKDPDHQIVMSLFMEPVRKGMTPEQYRDSLAERGREARVPVENDTMYTIGNIAIQENIVPVMNQWHLYACMVKDSIGIELHLSSMESKEEVLPYVTSALVSMTIVENYQPTSFDYFNFGSKCYNADNLKDAIVYYEQAVASEKETHIMPRPYWLAMVDNLGMAYGISGDTKNAKRVFYYGLTVEPEYPMFHYNLACAYSDEKNLDSTLAHLEQTYLHKTNMIPGEEIPDPYKDNSFKRYWNKREFNQLMRKVSKDGSL